MSEVKVKSLLSSAVFPLKNKFVRVLWAIFYYVFFRFSPRPFFVWRLLILKAFGAKIGSGARVYPSVRIWLPSNLILGDQVALADGVKIYNQGEINIGSKTIVSQGAHLCSSTHDYNDPVHPIVLSPINIGRNVWICADAFVGPGITLGEGTVIGARAVICKDTEVWCVYVGNPAIKVNERKRFE